MWFLLLSITEVVDKNWESSIASRNNYKRTPLGRGLFKTMVLGKKIIFMIQSLVQFQNVYTQKYTTFCSFIQHDWHIVKIVYIFMVYNVMSWYRYTLWNGDSWCHWWIIRWGKYGWGWGKFHVTKRLYGDIVIFVN